MKPPRVFIPEKMYKVPRIFIPEGQVPNWFFWFIVLFSIINIFAIIYFFE